ncbi:uncharacterized protein LOC116288192 [Actinia tenebrosa]|uniref:Uncharacterized protein LOC116288192 n=1 Tax=Actinia tenebrosa TaxID=6105 RepID=A0A6P8HDU0_ACTTE|nr:uncharacterized protein LOC116288192 [Actinia tenebrosa]
MARKRQQTELEEKRTENEKEEIELLGEEESSKEEENEEGKTPKNTSDTLENTLGNLNKNMEIMAESMTSMHKAMKRMAKTQDKSLPKRRKVEMSDSDIDSSIESENSDVDSDSLLKESPETKKGGKNDPKDDLLDSIANDLDADEKIGPDVSDKLANIVNKRWSEKLNSEKLSDKLKKKKHARPGNLKNLVVPRVNPEIWSNMNHHIKREDLRRASTQNTVAKVGSILAKCTDILLKARNDNKKELDIDEMIGLHTDAIAILGHTQYELSMARRDAIKPSLKKEYAGLCSQNIPVTSLLFGDELQQQLNNIKASNRITQTAAGEHRERNTFRRDSWKQKQSDNYFKRSYQSQYRGKYRGNPKNSRSPSYKRKEGGKN